MSPVLLFLLFFMIALDIENCKKLDRPLFDTSFQVKWTAFIWPIIFFGVAMSSAHAWEIFLLFSCLYVFPLYLLRRDQFLRRLPEYPPEHNDKKILLSDAYGVVIIWFYAMAVFSFLLKRDRKSVV